MPGPRDVFLPCRCGKEHRLPDPGRNLRLHCKKSGTLLIYECRVGSDFRLRGPHRDILLGTQPIVIGRHPPSQIVVDSPRLSRQHCRVSPGGEGFVIEDLGSTNGTFVNGEKISRSRITEGDRILVGTSIIKMVAVTQGAVHASEEEARRRLEAGANRHSTSGRPMSGVIEEIPLPDLLQLLSTSRKSGVLSVATPSAIGKIFLRNGQIYFAAINEDFAIAPQKAIYRMLTWTTGTFELSPSVEMQVMEELHESTEALLMEGVRQLDEFNNLGGKLPAPHSALAVPTPLAGKLRELKPEELDVFQLVLDHGQLQAVLDNFPGSDLDAAQALLALMKREFVVVP